MENNWALVVSHAGDPPDEHLGEHQRAEPEMESRLETLKKKWEKRAPDTEVSIVSREGDRIYMARYFEGVVIRLEGLDGPVTFLTTEMAKQFGEWLMGSPHEKAKR